MTVHFTREQIDYLMRKTGSEDPEEAMEVFVGLMTREGIPTSKIPVYLNKLMERDRGK